MESTTFLKGPRLAKSGSNGDKPWPKSASPQRDVVKRGRRLRLQQATFASRDFPLAAVQTYLVFRFAAFER